MDKQDNMNNDIDLYSETRYQKNSDGNSERTVIWRDGEGMHTETTVINKTVPSVGVILLIALVFTIIGAAIAALLFLARYGKDFALFSRRSDAVVTEAPTQSELPTLEPVKTPEPTPGETNNPSGHEGDTDSVGFGAIPELYRRNVTGVVIIQSYSGTVRLSNLVGTGTGFCISENGYIMTNAHVVKDADNFIVTSYSNRKVSARLIGSDVRTDIAVLKIEETDLLTVLTIGDSSKVRTGDFVFTIGHPTGDELSFTATFGMVGAVERSVSIEGVRNNYIQIDAAINPGNSGGPLFDMQGNVIGVNSAKTVIASYNDDGDPISAEGLGFALPINMALETATKIIDEGGILRPGIGISTIFVNEEVAEQYSIPTGALVYTITEDGPGHLAGLKIDDIITDVDGVAIDSNDTLVNYIRTKSVGDVIRMNIFRDGETLEIEVTVGDLNSIGSTILDNAYGGEKYGLR